MNARQATNKNGFTIIEVVLVLAIAALIFLMVFIALPSLQRNQRDTQRKDDIGRTLTAVNNYQSNNRGKLPAVQTDWDDFGIKYLNTDDDEFQDPSEGEDYVFDLRTGTDAGDAPP
ncbi:MAG: prepilin-type N-terminal cleavage/methylation domain-containing protein, partial [Patescibacteria group bacterium]